jgi:hypothetical protein
MAKPNSLRRGKTTARGVRRLPVDAAAWLRELRAAYEDARETLPFMPLAGVRPDEKQLYHLAPHVALKFRGLPESRRGAAVEAALTSIVASRSAPDPAQDPFTLFAFSYLASHFGLELLSEVDVQKIMGLVAQSDQRGEDDDA